MKYISSIKNTVIVSALLTSLSTSHGAGIALDGINTNTDNYTNSESVSWFNGHRPAPDSIYGDFATQLGSTTIRHQVAELDGGTPGEMFFFVYIEAPLLVKNMIWQDLGKDGWKNDFPLSNANTLIGLTEADVASYRVHHETHHNAGDMKLDFEGATGSEKLILVNDSGVAQFTADLAGDADNSFGLVGFKDSVDYLFDNSLATTALSLNRDTAMSFEFQFTLDPTDNEAILALARNGLEFHLSPERGLPLEGPPIPESSTAMLGLIGLMMILRRRFR